MPWRELWCSKTPKRQQCVLLHPAQEPVEAMLVTMLVHRGKWGTQVSKSTPDHATGRTWDIPGSSALSNSTHPILPVAVSSS